MFGFLKNRKLKAFRRETSERIAASGTNIEHFIDEQVGVIVGNLPVDREEAWDFPLTPFYVFGACDAVLCEFPLEVRQQIGPAIIELGFVRIAKNVFHVDEATAKRSLAAVFEIQRQNPIEPAIMEGGADGIQMMQRLPAARLVRMFSDAFEGL